MRHIRRTTALAALMFTAVACGNQTSSQFAGDRPTDRPTDPSQTPSQGADGDRNAPTTARDYAATLLDALTLPSDAEQASRAPSKALEHLPQRPSLIERPTVLERFWTVPRSATATLAWLRQHGTDSSLRADGSGGSGSTGGRSTGSAVVSRYLIFQAASLPEGITFGQVMVAVVSTGPDSSAIGAYAVTLAQPERTSAERVPLDVDRATIRWTLAPGGTPAQKTLTGQAARDLTQDFDALRVDARGPVMCPMIPAASEISVTFSGSGHSWRVKVPGCPNLSVTRDGQRLPALAFGKAFLADIKATTGFLPPTGPIRAGGVIPLIQPPSAH